MKEKSLGWYIIAAVGLVLGGMCLSAGENLAGGCFFVAAALVLAMRVYRLTRQSEEVQEKLDESIKTCQTLQKELKEQQVESQEAVSQAAEQGRKEILRFCSEISHEMRLPISIIAGYADLLCGDIVKEEDTKKEYLKKISERIRFLNDILSRHLSQVRAGQQGEQLEKSKVDILAMLREIARDAAAAAIGKGILIQVLSVERELYVFADSAHLMRAFYNIIENAFQYMGRAGTISITVTQKDRQALIVFRDDGMGLPAEEAEHIFELNFQGSNHVEGEGRGHGLYFVRMSVEAHGGTISAQSAPGKGMCITISLPIGP